MQNRRLDVNDPQVWNLWRKFYYELTVGENIDFGNQIEAKYPGQASFDPKTYDIVFTLNSNRPSVFEFGGWKGELAEYCLQRYNIQRWTNIDMCLAAVIKTVCKDLRYYPRFPVDFEWFENSIPGDSFDVFIAAHAIEHLTWKHLQQLITNVAVRAKTVVFEAPISNGPHNWENYEGTHILEVGWDEINKLMKSYGYRVDKLTDIAYLYEKASEVPVG